MKMDITILRIVFVTLAIGGCFVSLHRENVANQKSIENISEKLSYYEQKWQYEWGSTQGDFNGMIVHSVDRFTNAFELMSKIKALEERLPKPEVKEADIVATLNNHEGFDIPNTEYHVRNSGGVTIVTKEKTK